jgi:deazaflavin-dependent oxidoreductase (nitroreductase family)
MSEKTEQEKTEQEKAQAGKSTAIPSDMKAFNAKVIADFRANHGKFTGPMAGRGVLILTTTGARTGKERSTVLGYGRDGDRLVVIASDNGAPAAPAWYHNLLARPIATVELGPEPFKVRARVAKPEERDELAKAVPYLAQQQTLTKREIPIVVLERS